MMHRFLWLRKAKQVRAVTSKLLRTDGTAWGEEPVRTAFTGTGCWSPRRWSTRRARPTATLAIDTLMRGALEAAAQAWWLMDPAISGRVRVAPLHVVRRRSGWAVRPAAVGR